MTEVRNRGDFPIDKMLKVFKKQVEKDGILGDLKSRQHYDKPSVKKKLKRIAAKKRRQKQLRKEGKI